MRRSNLSTNCQRLAGYLLLHLVVFVAAEKHVAVCFWGLTRSLWATKDSLRHCIFDPLAQEGYKISTFLHTFRVEEEGGDPIFWDNYRLLQPKKAIVESTADVELATDTPDLEVIKQAGDPWHNGFHSSRNYRLALHSLNAVTALWAADPAAFDAVLYTRSDLWFFNQLNISEFQQSFTAPNSVYLPGWDFFGGVNDRFAFGHPAAMHFYGSRVKLVKKYVEHSSLHAETFLRDVLHEEQLAVEYISIRFTRVRASGEMWSLPDHKNLTQFSPFSDEDLHAQQATHVKLQRNEQGMLELVPL